MPAQPLDDQRFMRRALELALRAQDEGEVPVGALVVKGGEIVAEGWNQTISARDTSAHAEIQALRAAGQALGNYRFPDCSLYVTLEPCVMCAGALVHARLERVVYAAADPKTGAAGSVFDVLCNAKHNHQPQLTGGVLAQESREMLQAFFRARR